MKSVLNYLFLFGMEPQGFKPRGMASPSLWQPNDSAENKAKNGGVELVRLNR